MLYLVNSCNLVGSDKHNVWLFDSGAQAHFANSKSYFSDFRVCNNVTVRCANNSVSKVEGVGDVYFENELWLKNVYFCPGLKHNYIPASKIFVFQRMVRSSYWL